MCICRTRRKIILNTVDDLVTNFLYYDRKEDKSLPVDAIKEAISVGEIRIMEIVNHFESNLRKGLTN